MSCKIKLEDGWMPPVPPDRPPISGAEAADNLFKMFLKDFSLSEEDLKRRKDILLELPNHLSESSGEKLGDVILLPFGTFYHGVGFKDDPLTAYVTLGKLEDEPAVHKGRSSEEKEEGEIVSQNWNDGRMKQTLLLDIHDTITDRENCLSRVYKNVALTRNGKLYLEHTPAAGEKPIRCLLEAKSFLVVQVSRLIKLYCMLEPVFWAFSQLVLHWAKMHSVMDDIGRQDSDGLKQDHLMLLIIFFLVRRRIIPSFTKLQEWSTSELTVDGINIAFCENVEHVRRNGRGSMSVWQFGTEASEWTLERILQLVYEFMSEISMFDFVEYGISPGSGTCFQKKGQQQKSKNEKRRLNTNSLLCLQDILDTCQNTGWKVNEECVAKLKIQSKAMSETLFPFLWRGDVLNATLKILDTPSVSSSCSYEYSVEKFIDVFDPSSNLAQLQRLIRFRVPMWHEELLIDANTTSMCLNFQNFQKGIRLLFMKFLQEFNGVFWENLVAAKAVKQSGDPMAFPFVHPVSCPADYPKTMKTLTIVNEISTLLISHHVDDDPISETMHFFIQKDWTRAARDDIFVRKANVKEAPDICESLMRGIERPPVIYGFRTAQPKVPNVYACVTLEVKHVGKQLQVNTFVRRFEGLDEDEGKALQRYVDWYNVLVKPYVLKKFSVWVGKSVIDDWKNKLLEFTRTPKTETANLTRLVRPSVSARGKKKSTTCLKSKVVKVNGPQMQPQASYYNGDVFNEVPAKRGAYSTVWERQPVSKKWKKSANYCPSVNYQSY